MFLLFIAMSVQSRDKDIFMAAAHRVVEWLRPSLWMGDRRR